MAAQEVRDTAMWGRHQDARSGSIPQRNLSFASVSKRKSRCLGKFELPK
jgi:hypothetical protein